LNHRKILFFSLSIILLALLFVWILFFGNISDSGQQVVINNTAAPPLPTLDAGRVTEGAELYSTYCASCHGADLEGADEWKRTLPDGSLPPPPHDNTGHTWHHPDGLLVSITLNGGGPAYDSRMPAFGDQLSEHQVLSILEFIKSKWGKDEREFQWWITVTQNE
jgi:mono/diheme cytochrome c family protein